MNIRQLKNIMKEINEPNEFELYLYADTNPNYWTYKVENVRVKTLFSKLENLRKPSARFDVFINGLFISENDYIFEQKENDFYIRFKKSNFPAYDRFGNEYVLDESDEIKINGDVEKFNIGI